jgi:NADH:ubiquinone oxidoreductase subunit 5 (subunit L)/multisubunit Na+/H+ antiporter MnhA subunit
LLQREVLRIGVFAVSSQAGLMLAAFGVGGYSPALFLLFTGGFLAVLYFLAAGNLIRGFRSRELADCVGGRLRMPRTTLALGGWAVGISGLTLNTYSVLSATFRDVLPNGGHVSAVAQVVVAVAVLATVALTALYAFRVYFMVATGEPVRRRGFDVTRLREVDARLRRTAFLALGGAGVATVVGIPGLTSVTVGSREGPGLTFSRFVFYGRTHQQLGFDALALLLALLLGAAGALAARWMFATGSRAATAPAMFLARARGLLAAPTPAERTAPVLAHGFIAAGERLDTLEVQLLEPIPAAMGESVEAVSDAMTRLRSARLGLSLAAAFAVVAMLLAASVLAATGHFPVSI